MKAVNLLPQEDRKPSWWERLLLHPGVPGHASFTMQVQLLLGVTEIMRSQTEILRRLDAIESSFSYLIKTP